jgi:aminopeptidase-like protein
MVGVVLETGDQLHALVERLFPLPRSLTGVGVRQTLAVLAEYLPLQVTEVPTGTAVLDWTVPREWSVREAHVTGPDGERLVDWADGPLHLVGHSAPYRGRVDRAELLAHLHSLPDRPTLTPYRTSYYADTWGFCLPHDRVDRLVEGDYDVVVDTDLAAGSMTYGEVVVPGRSADEVLVSAHVCHPAQANDNLSGIAVAAGLARRLLEGPTPRHTFRFLFAPGTLGAIAWLDRHRDDAVPRLKAGLVLTGLGDPSSPSYKRSRRGDTLIDRAVEHVLHHAEPQARLLPFTPYGYDERQFCSPGFDLPVGRLGRGVHGEYPEYHTSADDLSFVSADRLAESSTLVAAVVQVLEEDQVLVNQAPYGEPQLGRRGLYRSTGATRLDARATEMALLWTLSLCDGSRSLLAVAEQADLPFASIAGAAQRLKDVGLVA